MGRYLIVANQTLGGAELDAKISDRIEHGEGRFHVVVPLLEPEQETTTWAPHDPTFAIPAQSVAASEALEEARQRSQHRLRRMVDRITELGGEADGELGDPDPLTAVKNAMKGGAVDEVIVSTLPAGISRWIKMDLSSRIDRMVDCPVTTVEAETQ